MILPFTGNYPVTREFGVYDPAYANYPGSRHPGTDWALPANTPLFAATDGVATVHDRDASIKIGRGKEVSVGSGNTRVNTCHMNRIDVKQGQVVKQGEQIGLSGSTGFSTGPHLHAEVVINGQYADPKKHFKENDMQLSTAEEVNALWQLNGLRAPNEKEVKEALGRELSEYLGYLLKTEPVKANLAKVKFYDQDVKAYKEDAQAWRKFVKDVAKASEEEE